MPTTSSSTSGNPITVDSYATGSETNKPAIIGSAVGGILNDPQDSGTVKLTNRSWWIIQNIEVQAPCTNGVLLQGCSNVTVQYCDFSNVKYMQRIPTPSTNQGTGLAVYIGPSSASTSTDGANNTVQFCNFRHCDFGVWINSGDNIKVQDSNFTDIWSVGTLWAGHVVQFGVSRTVTNSYISRCIFDYTNTQNDGWNPIMIGGTNNCYVEFCEVKNSPSGNHDHQTYDYDTNCKNTYIQYCYSHDNNQIMHNYFAGAAANNGGCVFRYNLSVNESIIYSPGNNYGLVMYNNTFYNFLGNFGRNPTSGDLNGIVLTNNIFYLKSSLTGTWSNTSGSDYNCYYNAAKPSAETHSIQANPLFVWGPNPPHGLQITSTSPCRNAGTSIAGNGGKDYWGHALYSGVADIGAHEYDGSAVPNNANLGMNKIVTASSSVENWGWFKAFAVDGTVNSVGNTNGYSSALGVTTNHTEWIKVDLGASYSINRVKLWPRNDYGYVGLNYPVDFTIQTSTDDSTYTTQVTVTGAARPANQAQVYSFGAVTARYVKVNATSLRLDGTTYMMQLAELEVLNDTSTVPPTYVPTGDFALGKDVQTSTSAENWDWFRVKATDGKRDSVAGSLGWSSWNSPTNDPSPWIMVDLQAIVSVSKVTLCPRNDAGQLGTNFPVNFTIQTSTDGNTWTTRVTQTSYPKPTDGLPRDFTFTAANARFVRVNGTVLDSGLMAFAEIEVY